MYNLKIFRFKTEIFIKVSLIKNMRLFVALDIPEELKHKVLEIQKRFDSEKLDIKFVEPENLHITLKFLGEVHQKEIMNIEERIFKIVKEFSPFSINLHGVDYFGNKNYIRVLWINVKKGKEKLIEIINNLNQQLNYIRKDEHRPNPHLTIGRVRSGKNRERLLRILESVKDMKIGEIIVNEIKLKQSILTPKGPIYKDIKTFSLVK